MNLCMIQNEWFNDNEWQKQIEKVINKNINYMKEVMK